MSFLERDNFTFVPSPSQATLEAAENHSGPKRTFCSEISNFCRLDGAAKRFVHHQLSRVNAQKTVLSLCRQVSGPTGQARPLRDGHPDTSENHVCPSYGARAPHHGRVASWGLGLVGWTPGPGGRAGPHEPP